MELSTCTRHRGLCVMHAAPRRMNHCCHTIGKGDTIKLSTPTIPETKLWRRFGMNRVVCTVRVVWTCTGVCSQCTAAGSQTAGRLRADWQSVRRRRSQVPHLEGRQWVWTAAGCAIRSGWPHLAGSRCGEQQAAPGKAVHPEFAALAAVNNVCKGRLFYGMPGRHHAAAQTGHGQVSGCHPCSVLLSHGQPGCHPAAICEEWRPGMLPLHDMHCSAPLKCTLGHHARGQSCMGQEGAQGYTHAAL